METSVEGLCNQLARHKLLAPDAVRSLRQRLRTDGREGVDDVAKFGKWLIGQGVVTDFQIGMITRGFTDLLILNEYRLMDRIGQGRMAGVYKAMHELGQIVAIK